MKLYSGGRAPNPRRVQIFLAEKEVEIETAQLDIAKLEQKKPEFTAINSRQRLPALVLDSGQVITETIAICRYFEMQVPEPNMMGKGAVECAEIEMWQRRMELEFFMPVAFSFRHLHPVAQALEPVQITEWGKISQTNAQKALAELDRHMAERDYIVADRFTIADITAFCAYQFLKPARIVVPDALTNLKRWFEGIISRPSTQW